jgi:Arc/MetJ-type ribon-helix-helix transcriptional regulator
MTMTRRSIIGVSLTAKELKMLRARVHQGGYLSESDVIRDGLRRMFREDGRATIPLGRTRTDSRRLAAAYRAMAAHDRNLAREWSGLKDPWPNT